MRKAFENSYFCSIAHKFKHYKGLVQAMEHLNSDAQMHRTVLEERARGIATIEESLKGLRKQVTTEVEQ